MPSGTSYKAQYVILLAHLTSIGLFVYALVQVTEKKQRMRQMISLFTGAFNFLLLMLRSALEIIYINYHPEDYIRE